MLLVKLRRVTNFSVLCVAFGFLGGCGAARWETEDAPIYDRKPAERIGDRLPSSPKVSVPPAGPERQVTVSSLLNDYYIDWRGTPYRFGGTSRNGIDCSAFTQQAMSRALGIPLPRTTSEQLKKGVPIEAGLTRPGDLVFFKTGEALNHVGVIVGPAKFMHASTSNGVTLSRLDDSYWSSRVIGYRRVIE